MRHHGHALCRYTLTLHLSLEKGQPADRQAITGLVCTTVAGAALLRTSGAETVRLLQSSRLPVRLQAHATSNASGESAQLASLPGEHPRPPRRHIETTGLSIANRQLQTCWDPWRSAAAGLVSRTVL